MKYKYLILLITLAVVPVDRVTAQNNSDVDTTFDGLVAIKKGVFKRSWVDPDVDLSQYTKILPGGAHFEFRAVKKTSSMATRRMNQREFYISDADRQKLIDTVSQIFEDELAKSKHFTIVEAPGPDVMVLRGGLLDIVSHVPPDSVGRDTIYLSSVGQATLVLELLDSLSGETIYRGVERRTAGQSNIDMIGSSPVRSWAEVKRWARRWGARLRVGLDSIHK